MLGFLSSLSLMFRNETKNLLKRRLNPIKSSQESLRDVSFDFDNPFLYRFSLKFESETWYTKELIFVNSNVQITFLQKEKYIYFVYSFIIS